MEKSILKTIKKSLGLRDDYTAFDQDVLLWINSAISTLRDLGIGPPGFYVEDDEAEWDQLGESVEDTNMIRSYVYLRAKVMFDPPSTTHVMTAMNAQIAEQEWRLSVAREGRDWVDPTPPPDIPEVI